MSRIHDALKRSEQERSRYKGIGIEEVEPPAVGPIPVSAADAVPDPPIQPEAPPPTLGTLDAILASCRTITWRPDSAAMLFCDSAERVHGVEEFRTLRSRLYQLRQKQSLRKLLITSSLHNEGRSFVAANLAQVMTRQPGCRTLLIDADLRNPSLHSALGTSSSPGLAEYLLGETEEFGIIQRGQIENLFFIPAGRPVAGQTEMLSNGRFKVLLDRFTPLFDWIVIDSPAAMPVSDSVVIANLCDGVLMVVRSNATAFDVVRKTLQKFQVERLVGVVLNGMPAGPHPEIETYHNISDTSGLKFNQP